MSRFTHTSLALAALLSAAIAAPTLAAPAGAEQVSLNMAAPAKGSASKVISSFYGTLDATMKDGPQLGFDGRYQKLQAAVDRTFNLNEMARTSVGPSWVKASPQEQQGIEQAFRKFSVANYASRFEKHTDEKFAVVGEKPGSNPGETVVETTLTSGGETHNLNYVMKQGPKGWQVTDVYVDGAISEIATRRSEFSSVVRDQGFDGLQKLLISKSDEMANS